MILAHALHDISGLPITSLDQAREIVRKIPRTIRWRLFVVYRGNLPEDRYSSCMGLFQAPDHRVFNERIGRDPEADAEPEDAALVRRFGAAEIAEARQVELALAGHATTARRRE